MKNLNNKTLLPIFLLVFLGIGFAKTELKKENTEPNKIKPSPQKSFDHEAHEKPLEKEKLECTYCHPFKLNWKDRTVSLPKDVKSNFVKPLMELCHSCHQTKAKIKKEIFNCSLCHADAKDILPDSHRSGWIKQHAVKSYSATECQSCHEDTFCIDCHRRFEPIKPKVHSRNFRFFHSVEARVNPASCYSCHRQSVCVHCHQTGKAFR